MTEHRSETPLSEFDAGGDPQDELFDVLSNPRRRFIMHSLQVAERPVSLGELTTDIVAWEVRRSVSERSGGSRETITVSLVHNHLPMMARTGLVSYDDGGQMVALADRTDEVEAHLETMADHQH